MEYVGKAKLLEVKSYRKQDKDGELKQKFIYVFLTGSINEKNGFLTNAEVHQFISDEPIALKEPKLFSEIDVAVSLQSFKMKVADGKYVDTQKATYVVLPSTK